MAATVDGADRIARSEMRINRGIEAASRLDEPRGGEVMRTVAGQAAGGPHPRDAGFGVFQARQSMAKQHGIVGQYGESHRNMTELPLAQSQLREFLSTQ